MSFLITEIFIVMQSTHILLFLILSKHDQVLTGEKTNEQKENMISLSDSEKRLNTYSLYTYIHTHIYVYVYLYLSTSIKNPQQTQPCKGSLNLIKGIYKNLAVNIMPTGEVLITLPQKSGTKERHSLLLIDSVTVLPPVSRLCSVFVPVPVSSCNPSWGQGLDLDCVQMRRLQGTPAKDVHSTLS